MKTTPAIRARLRRTARWRNRLARTPSLRPAWKKCIPPGPPAFVEVEGLSNRLDGASRPGHFRGVATVVAKLFIAAEPDLAFFGQKDAAQVAVLRRMTADLRLGTEIVVCPIVRDPTASRSARAMST